jgi:hypothetical protein
MSDIPTDKEINSVLESIYGEPDNIPAMSLSYEYLKSIGVSDEFIADNMAEVDHE